MDEGIKQHMLGLARKVLENEIHHSRHDLKEMELPELEEKRGLFVTLQIKGKLRGCIGRLEPQKSIFQNIIELSKAAAFEDHRFKNLSSKELKIVRIEISLLSLPEKVEGESTIEKVMKIKPKKDGVIISSGHQNATFLPQVWDSIPLREDFMSNLCQKAGFPGDYWESNELELSVYRVEHFEEEKGKQYE